MEIKTFIGNKELIKSEMLHLDQSSVRINISDLTLIFEFKSDTAVVEKVAKEIVNDKTLKIKCYNLDNSLGEGVLAPIEIGFIDNKNLYLSFFVWTPNKSEGKRLLNYCLYLGD